MKFDMAKPCDDCPFRKDGQGVGLLPGRWEKIRRALVDAQLSFPCHKTIRFDPDEDPFRKDGDADWHIAAEGEQHCAGALIALEKMGRPNQMMRWMERIEMYDRSKLDMTQDVGFGPHRGGCPA